ncbi:MAG: oxidoreductase [Candidatus Cloacimonadota bacterium]|nr:MAG: oxidoreductase [Candidatus Cloacimonadota bacterium]
MINAGIVGVGQFGQNHARILSESKLCNFVGLYDKNKKRAKEISERINAKAFPDFDSLLEECDALVIVVTTISHFELAEKALNKGIHVFIEKPITETFEQAEKLVKLAKEKNLKIQVGHIERFNPAIMKIDDQIENPLFIECHRIAPFTPRGSDVPVVLELMIHDIDLILDFVKSEVTDIRASGASVATKSIDIANARIEFANGATANVVSSRISMKRERKFRFFQKGKYFSIDFKNKQVRIISKSKQLYKILPSIMIGKTNFEESKDKLVNIVDIDASVQEKDALTMELEAFIASAENNIEPVVNGEAGMRALKVALEIVEKIKPGSIK